MRRDLTDFHSDLGFKAVITVLPGTTSGYVKLSDAPCEQAFSIRTSFKNEMLICPSEP